MSVKVAERGICTYLKLGGYCKLGSVGGAVEQATFTDVNSPVKPIIVEKGKYFCVYARNPEGQATCSTSEIQETS